MDNKKERAIKTRGNPPSQIPSQKDSKKFKVELRNLRKRKFRKRGSFNRKRNSKRKYSNWQKI
jgi:hypothetical protein